MNAVDTNILIYSIDRHEAVKRPKAQQLLQQLHAATEPTFLLWQVLAESVQQLRRAEDQGKITHPEFLQHVQAFRHLFPLVLPHLLVRNRLWNALSHCVDRRPKSRQRRRGECCERD